MTTKLEAAAASAAPDVTILGLSIEAFAASASACFALVSIMVAGIALRASARSERELRLVRQEDLTDKRISEFDNSEMVALREWVHKKLAHHAAKNKCQFGGGLTQLNVGEEISFTTPAGARSYMAGQACIRVMRFYNRVARQITENRLEVDRIVDVMGDDIVATWRALGPYLRHKTVKDYYEWFRRRYSMASLATALTDNDTRAARIAALKKRPRWTLLPRYR